MWRCRIRGAVAVAPPTQTSTKPPSTTINADNLILDELTIAKMLLDEDPATVRIYNSIEKEKQTN